MKPIKIQEETHETLKQLKLIWGLKSIDEVIQTLMQKASIRYLKSLKKIRQLSKR